MRCLRDRQDPDDKVIVQDFGSYSKGYGKQRKDVT